MSKEMKKHLAASWLIYTTTPDPPAGDPPAGDPPADPPAGDPPAAPDGAGDPPADPDPSGTPLVMDDIPESMRSLFEGIETQEDLAARLKGPEVPETYTPPTDLPEGVTIDEAMFTEFQEIAKAQGLTQAQVENLVKFQVGIQEKNIGQVFDKVLELQAAGFKSELGKLKESMGESFDPAHQVAMKSIAAVADDGIMTELKATGLIDSPLMFKLGKQIYEKLLKEDAPPMPNLGSIKDGIRSGSPDTAKDFYGRMNKEKAS